MKTLNLILALIGILLLHSLRAQQTSLNTLYSQNLYMINPASAGQTGCFSAYLNHRNQWVGINGSPQRNLLTLDTRIKSNHGIGVEFNMYKAGLLSNFVAKATYAYHIKLGEKAFLSAGISAGIIQQKFLLSDVIASDYSDNTLAQGNQSAIGFTSDAGLMFYTGRVRIGLSVPQVFSKGIDIQTGNFKEEFRLVQHMTLYGSYDIISNEHWKLTPSVLYKNAALIGHQVDVGARVGWNNMIGLSAIYRSKYGFAGIFDLNLFDKFKLSYSYGFGANGITGVSKGSHEVMLGINICRKSKEKPIEIIENPTIIVDTVTMHTDTTTTLANIVEESDTLQEPETIDSVITVPEEKAPWEIDIDSLNSAFDIDQRMILFELNSGSTITSSNEKDVLIAVSSILKEHSDLKVILEGHTCNLGSNELNFEISEERANQVRKELLKLGIDPDRILIDSKGEQDPAYDNAIESQRSKNRRVRIIFTR